MKTKHYIEYVVEYKGKTWNEAISFQTLTLAKHGLRNLLRQAFWPYKGKNVRIVRKEIIKSLA